MLFYFTAVIAFHVHSVKFYVYKNIDQTWGKQKKRLHVCPDSSIQLTQADQLNETNHRLAFRVSSK